MRTVGRHRGLSGLADISQRMWVIVAIAAVFFGAVARHAGMNFIGTACYIMLGAAFIYARKTDRFAAALQASLVVLSLALSVVAPSQINAGAPLVAAGFCILAVTLESRRTRIVWVVWTVGALAVVIVASTILSGSIPFSAKITGLGAMWVLVVVTASNVVMSSRRAIMKVIVGIAAISSLVAVLEGPMGIDFVRQYVSAGISGEYVANWTAMYGFVTVRAQATFGYPIILGAVIAMSLVYIVVSTKAFTIARVALILLLFIGLVTTGARSAIIAVGAGVATYAALVIIRAIRKKNVRTAMHEPALRASLAIAVGGAATAMAFLARSISIGDLSLFHRSGVLAAVFDLPQQRSVAENLIGSGYGSVERLFAEQAFGPELQVPAMDNTFAWVFVVGGVVSFALFFGTLVGAWINADLLVRSMLAVLGAEFFFFDVFNWHVMSFLLFLLIGLAFSRPQSASNEACHGGGQSSPTDPLTSK